VLIGLRQWDADKEFASKSSKTEKNIQKCDLLEIYSSSEREKLRVQEKIFQDLVAEGGGGGADSGDGSGSNSDDEFKANHAVEFKDQKTLEYQEIISQGGKLSRLVTTSYADIYNQISDSDDDGDRDHHDHHHDHHHDDHRDHDDHDNDPKANTNTRREAADLPQPPPPSTHRRQKLEEVNIDDI
jgi:hypothetical protein